MKNVVTFLMLTMFSIALFAVQFPFDKQKEESKRADYERLCKIFKQKVIDYKKTMRDDAYARATLESYQKRAEIFCKKK